MKTINIVENFWDLTKSTQGKNRNLHSLCIIRTNLRTKTDKDPYVLS